MATPNIYSYFTNQKHILQRSLTSSLLPQTGRQVLPSTQNTSATTIFPLTHTHTHPPTHPHPSTHTHTHKHSHTHITADTTKISHDQNQIRLIIIQIIKHPQWGSQQGWDSCYGGSRWMAKFLFKQHKKQVLKNSMVF